MKSNIEMRVKHRSNRFKAQLEVAVSWAQVGLPRYEGETHQQELSRKVVSPTLPMEDRKMKIHNTSTMRSKKENAWLVFEIVLGLYSKRLVGSYHGSS